MANGAESRSSVCRLYPVKTQAKANQSFNLLDRNLMAPDDFKNLGLIFEKQEGQSASSSASAGTGNNAQTGS